MDLISNNQAPSKSWLNLVLTTTPMSMEKRWTEPLLKNYLNIITMKKLLMSTTISQGLDTQAKEKFLLTCHTIWDQYHQVSPSSDKQSRTMMSRVWPLRFSILLIALKLSQDASKMHSIYLMMQVELTHRL